MRHKKPSPDNRIGLLLTSDILDELDAMYPDKCPDPRDTERAIWMKAGERRLVEVLIAKFEQANPHLFLQEPM